MEIIYSVSLAVGFLTLFIYGWKIYNQLATLANNVQEAWANVTVALKKRHAVVPLLVNVASSAQMHEELIHSSQAAMRRQNIAAIQDAERGIKRAITVTIEAYPDLKANKAFNDLMQQLVEIENEIQATRLLFNRAVASYHRQLALFPISIFAVLFGYSYISFFAIDPAVTSGKAPEVSV